MATTSLNHRSNIARDAVKRNQTPACLQGGALVARPTDAGNPQCGARAGPTGTRPPGGSASFHRRDCAEARGRLSSPPWRSLRASRKRKQPMPFTVPSGFTRSIFPSMTLPALVTPAHAPSNACSVRATLISAPGAPVLDAFIADRSVILSDLRTQGCARRPARHSPRRLARPGGRAAHRAGRRAPSRWPTRRIT